jgi:hypothetical protein
MSGSFERLSYDAGAYCTDLKQSTAPLKYALDPVYANVCNPCRPADIGYIGRQGVSLSKTQSLVDLESELFLLNHANSRDPARKFNPCCDPASLRANGGEDGNGLLHFDDCSIKTDYSRITNPPCTLKGTGVNRYSPLCQNPQDENRWLMPSQVGISIRQVITDNWNGGIIPDVVSPAKQNPELDPVLPRPNPQVCTPQIQLQPLQACMVNYTSPLYTSFYVPTPTC